LWALTGTMAGCNQWAGELPPERQGRAYVFLNKSAKAMQFINRPYFKMGWFHRLFAHYIDPPLPEGIDDPTIYVVPFATSFDETGRAIFPCPPEHRRKEMAWKKECRPDLVVLCTGYRQEWDWLGEGYPKGPEECDVRGVCSSRDLSVGFIGFLRPGVGESLLPQISNSPHFNWIVWNGFRSFYKRYICAWSLADAHVRRNPTNGRTTIPTSPETYHLLHTPTSRIQYGVDYSTYMAQLARDMGSAPSLGELLREYGWFITFVYWWVTLSSQYRF